MMKRQLKHVLVFISPQEFREKADALAQSKSAVAASAEGSAKESTSSLSLANSGSKASASAAGHYTERDSDGEDELVVVNNMRPASTGASSDRKGGDDAGDSKAGAPETEVPRAEAKVGPASTVTTVSTNIVASSSSGAKAQAPAQVDPVSSLSSSMGAATLNTSMNTLSAGKGLSPLKPLGGGARQALPHHIPKLDSLASKMDDIRKNMGEEVSGRLLCFLVLLNELVLRFLTFFTLFVNVALYRE